ncbi:hypothetical protein [Namhaeicola litoreus]|uniref:WD40-like Beta Propeller Repeat n=1 Tax=Namhaeicola litoreus TaxID=1052145 RepID=A0ABW3Y797_9FLAO
MIKNSLAITLFIVTNCLLAQDRNEVSQFSNNLNQYHSVRDFSMSENGNEAFLTIQSPFQEISQIVYIKKEKNKWSEPKLMPFSDSFMYMEPFLTADGKRLFFVSDRPLNDSIKVKKDFDIWCIERNNQDAEWSKPKNIGKPVNSDLDEFYPSVSENGNLYFTMVAPIGLGKDDIYFCKWDNGKYANPVLLSESINSAGYEFNAFISKGEDFILFTKYNEKDGYGSGDLYISKKDAYGMWENAKNIGEPINTKFMEYCPFYDEKNEILYFTSKRNDITPRAFKNVLDLQRYLSESNNGLSKIYMTKFKIE